MNSMPTAVFQIFVCQKWPHEHVGNGWTDLGCFSFRDVRVCLVERCVVSLIDSVFFDETDEADDRYTYC